jgi:hypothetical protein
LGVDISTVKTGQKIPASIVMQVTGTSSSLMSSGDNEASVNVIITDMDLGDNEMSDTERAAKMYNK